MMMMMMWTVLCGFKASILLLAGYMCIHRKKPVPIDEEDDMMMFMIPIRVVIKMTVGK